MEGESQLSPQFQGINKNNNLLELLVRWLNHFIDSCLLQSRMQERTIILCYFPSQNSFIPDECEFTINL